MPSTQIIHLVSCPRTLSTALLYAFAQRPDCAIIDEPYYGYFLAKTGASRPDREATLARWPNTIEQANNWINEKKTKPYLFLKNMAAHFIDVDLASLTHQKVVIYTRNPKQVLNSYSKVINAPTMVDLGFQKQWEMAEYLTNNAIDFVVLDSNDLLQDPGQYLEKLCQAIDMPYTDKMLSWPIGPKPYDGPWAKYWYANLHASTGFKKQESSIVKDIELPQTLQPLLEESMYYFNQLQKIKM